MKTAIKWLVVLVVLAGLGYAGFAYYKAKTKPDPIRLKSAEIVKGDLVSTIGATGTVEPVEVIDVGAQIAGQILTFGVDVDGKPVDYGSKITAGTVLARIEDRMYAAEVDSAKAQMAVAQSQVVSAQANMKQLEAKQQQAERDWKRAQSVGNTEALAQSVVDSYEAAYYVAKANIAVGEAAITQAQAQVAQAKAVLAKAAQNLSYCTIVSPVKGVIIDRRVNIGQTVVASLNAPSLFLIAKDITKMQVWVAVNEADIGQIKAGQRVTFTVDAFQGQTFIGEVGKVRLNAQMTQNVVTYIVEVNTDNSSGKLLPYLTANVQFEVAQAKDVLQVPNSALRYVPSDAFWTQLAQQEEETGVRLEDGGKAPETQPAQTQPSEGERAGKKGGKGGKGGEGRQHGAVWVMVGSEIKEVPVRLGITDGVMTQVSSPELSAGMKVVTGETVAQAPTAGATNPFVPQFGGRKGAGSGRR
jgi:HlyD family secretion protein